MDRAICAKDIFVEGHFEDPADGVPAVPQKEKAFDGTIGKTSTICAIRKVSLQAHFSEN